MILIINLSTKFSTPHRKILCRKKRFDVWMQTPLRFTQDVLTFRVKRKGVFL